MQGQCTKQQLTDEGTVERPRRGGWRGPRGRVEGEGKGEAGGR